MTHAAHLSDAPGSIAFAEALADLARGLAQVNFRSTMAYERKADDSPVTVADRAIELALRAAIAERYPDDGILGEEMGRLEGRDRLWVLDPIDGTKSFVTGMPLFGALIAVATEGVPRLGIVEMPALGERWSASEGTTTFNGAECRVSGCRDLGDARIYTSSPDVFPAQDWARYDRLSRRTALRRFGGDCYMYGLLASGYCDLVAETSLMPYDFMALVPVVEGAGGRMTDWEGRPLGLESDGRVLASSSAALHDTALKMLAESA
jgi:myo-inositol-1(or 4)-monophosphatase